MPMTHAGLPEARAFPPVPEPDAYRGRSVAVTGAQGYIGTALVAALRAAGADVLRVSSRPLPPSGEMRALQGAIDAPDTWSRIVAESDIVFHLAGNTSVYAAADDPAISLRSTVLPVALLAVAARAQQRRPRVVFASTATLYGLGGDGSGAGPTAEDAPLRPVNNYDLHKGFAEDQLRLASGQGLIDGVALRLANVYGPSSAGSSAGDRGILNRIARAALDGQPVSAFGGGDYVRDYVYIDDVVQAFLAAGSGADGAGRAFNVATGRGTTVGDAFRLVATCAARITGTTVAVEDAPWPAAADPTERRHFTADIGAIRQALGWAPHISIEHGIDRLVSAVAAQGKES